MATLVNRKVWWIGAASIQEGIVTKQNFGPDYVVVIANSTKFEEVRSSKSIFLTATEAIDDAREVASLLIGSAKRLEEELQG